MIDSVKNKWCREVKFCTICDKVRQHQNSKCRSCYEKNRRLNPEIKNIVYGRNRNYRSLNRDKRRVYENNRLKTNPSARIANRFRNWVNKLIERKTGNAVTLIGCSFEELKIYLESQWKPGMNWDNWSNNGWQIDHIKPLLSFDLTDPKQQKTAFHYTNLQPLWKSEHEVKTKQDLRTYQ